MVEFEGERIAYLAKHGDYKPGGQTVDEVDQNQAAALDDYVLHNLFKKSGGLPGDLDQLIMRYGSMCRKYQL